MHKRLILVDRLLFLQAYIHGQSLFAQTLAILQSDNANPTLPPLTLASLGGTTQIGLDLFCVASPKVAKASTGVTIACHCH
jgi:hypothetical protein